MKRRRRTSVECLAIIKDKNHPYWEPVNSATVSSISMDIKYKSRSLAVSSQVIEKKEELYIESLKS